MPKKDNRRLDTGGPPSAQAIIDALTCARRRCPCTSSARRGKGLTHCPAHDDRTPSLSVEERDGEPLVYCHAGCEQNAVLDALRERSLWPAAPVGNAGNTRSRSPAPTSGRRGTRSSGRETRYEIRDETGELVAVHVRIHLPDGDKRMWWELPDGTNGLAGTPVEDLPLYGAELLRELPDGAEVVLTEGEKAADALRGLGFAAVATVTGAAGTPSDAALRPLLRFTVYLWPDNDPAGDGHMQRIAERVEARGAQPRAIRWPDAPPKGDAADFVTQGGTAEGVRALLNAAAPWEPPAPVDGAAILNDVAAFVRCYVVMTDVQAEAVALWLVHTHAIDAADVTPYLHIASAEKRSGKSLALEVLELLAARPWLTGRVTPAVLVRKVDAEKPALLLDESDAAFGGDKEYAQTLRAVLNTGHRRGGRASVCVGQGANITYRDFSTFGPKAIAGIGRLPDTVADRSIRIEMKRKAPHERVERFRRRRAESLARPLRERLERWAAAHLAALPDADPVLPDALDDRAADGWEPLLAIADAAGGDWPERARETALALSVGEGREDDSLNVRLLADIRSIFEERGAERLFSSDLVAALTAMEEAPWADLRGKPMDAHKLAQSLKKYGIRPGQLRIGEKSLKGYERSAFLDAWKRYCPARPAGAETGETRETKDGAELSVEGRAVSAVSGVSSKAPSVAEPNGSHLRDYCRGLAEVLEWPRLQIRPEATVIGGAETWCKFLRCPTLGDLDDAIHALEALGDGRRTRPGAEEPR